MKQLLILLLLVASLMTVEVPAQTEIHKCTDADGGVMYSQLPCKDEVPVKVEEPEEVDTAESLAPEGEFTGFLVPDTRPEDAATGESRAACKKRYRDEIDAIDAEIRREYSKEKDGEYKQRLLALTRKLREC